jgi:hypothetical protein
MRLATPHTSAYIVERRRQRQLVCGFTQEDWHNWVTSTCRMYPARLDWQRWYPFVVAPTTSVGKAARMVARRANSVQLLHDACVTVLDSWHPAHDGVEATYVMLEFVLNATLTHVTLPRSIFALEVRMSSFTTPEEWGARVSQILARSRPLDSTRDSAPLRW